MFPRLADRASERELGNCGQPCRLAPEPKNDNPASWSCKHAAACPPAVSQRLPAAACLPTISQLLSRSLAHPLSLALSRSLTLSPSPALLVDLDGLSDPDMRQRKKKPGGIALHNSAHSNNNVLWCRKWGLSREGIGVGNRGRGLVGWGAVR